VNFLGGLHEIDYPSSGRIGPCPHPVHSRFREGLGVSWSNFQEERWKTDEAAMKAAIEAAGDTYVSTDAQSSAAKQLSDIESLMAQGVDALIVLAQDTQAIIPAVQAAADEGMPVIAYDRLIEDSRAFYLTFDNVEVGRMQARAVLAAAADRQLRDDQGLAHRPERRLPARRPAGSPAVGDRCGRHHHRRRGLYRRLAAGQRPAQHGADPDREDNKVDAVVASNDGTAGGVVAALTAQGMEGIPVSGQDGDHAALNRVAKGTQTVSVWKDARELGKAAGEDRRGSWPAARPWLTSTAPSSGLAFRHHDQRDVPRAGSDHQGQPRDGCRRWLDRKDRCARASPAARLPATDQSQSFEF
jgi:D-xylose transport system substrate-binding protein